MSTEYYLTIQPDLMATLRGEQSETIRIGTSLGGWCFRLEVYEHRGINSLTDWYKLFRKRRNTIKDEYEAVISWQDMMTHITDRSGNNFRDNPPKRSSYYHSEGHFLRSNIAEYGPNGCLRSQISEATMCFAHGAGTWDLYRCSGI